MFSAFVNHRHGNALRDIDPGREGWSKAIPFNDPSVTIPHQDLIDLIEEMSGRVGSEDIRNARINSHTRNSYEPTPGKMLVHGELVVAQRLDDPRLLVDSPCRG